MGVGVRRALYFNHVVVFAYLAYTGWVALFEPANLHLVSRLGIAAAMYLRNPKAQLQIAKDIIS